MKTSVAALAWEIWRKNRYGLLLLLLFLVVCVGLSRTATHLAAEASRLWPTAVTTAEAGEVIEANARATEWRNVAAGWSGVLFGLSLLVTLAVFAFAESSPMRGFSGIPSRLFTLPVRTGQLVLVPLVSGVCFVALLCLAWSRLVLAPILPPDAPVSGGYFLLLLPATLVLFQILVWTLPGFPKTRATLLTLLLTAFAVLCALPFGDFTWWPERKPALMAIYGVLLVTGPFVAWLGVARVRNGERRHWPALAAVATRLANAFSRRRDFGSPAAAQFWIECRRNGRLAFGGLALVILCVLGLNAVLPSSNGSSSVQFDSVYVPVLVFLVFIWTPILGLTVCGDAGSRRLPLTTFQAVRPVAVGELVAAKLKAMTALLLCGWVMAALSAIYVWAVLSGQVQPWFDRIVQNSESGMIAIVLGAISMHVLVGLFPLWLSGRVPGLPWSFVGLLVVFAGIANIVAWFARHSEYWHLALLLIGFAAAVKLGVAFLAFRHALKQKLVNRGFVAGTVSIWLFGTAICIELMSRICAGNGLDATLLVPFAALLFPIARLALAPLAMAMNRHR